MITPVRSAAVRKSDPVKWESIRIVNMTAKHAAFWDKSIWLPHILFGGEKRADRLWPWTAMRTVLPLQQEMKGGFRCRAFAVVKPGRHPRTGVPMDVPIAMMLLIEQYPHVIPEQGSDPPEWNQRSTFTWFIAAAPDSALKRLKLKPLSLGRTLVDTALVHSLENGCEGRMWLHCAIEGGDRLMDFYNGFLSNLPEDSPLPVRRKNDGRFFYSTEFMAQLLIAEMNGLR